MDAPEGVTYDDSIQVSGDGAAKNHPIVMKSRKLGAAFHLKL